MVEPVIPESIFVEPEVSFENLPQSTLQDYVGEGPSVPSGLFSLNTINQPADLGPIILERLLARGVPTGRTSEVILWEQTIPDTLVALPIQQKHRHRSIQVKLLYQLPNGLRYWKIYIQHEYTLFTQDTDQIEYRAIRQ